MRGATSWALSGLRFALNFNPRSSCEERLESLFFSSVAILDFNPRSSCEERRIRGQKRQRRMLFQSTLLMRGATRERGDNHGTEVISIHAPHARSDKKLLTFYLRVILFQSTLLMRGATRGPRAPVRALVNFNPRSSCEERHGQDSSCSSWTNFNPRSSCEERPCYDILHGCRSLFQSTLLMRGATSTCRAGRLDDRISIHAPHARSDAIASSSWRKRRFQSTLLMRGATCSRGTGAKNKNDFNPRSSCEERPQHT